VLKTARRAGDSQMRAFYSPPSLTWDVPSDRGLLDTSRSHGHSSDPGSLCASLWQAHCTCCPSAASLDTLRVDLLNSCHLLGLAGPCGVLR
jgi:hypothetical protein